MKARATTTGAHPRRPAEGRADEQAGQAVRHRGDRGGGRGGDRALASADPASENAARYRSCTDVVYRVNGAVYARTHRLQSKGVGCPVARKVALGWIRGLDGLATPRPRGYTCRPGSVRIVCTKGPRVVRWRIAA